MVAVLSNKSASLTLRPTPEGTVWLANLFSAERGKGHARELMRQVCDKADEEIITLQLDARQYGHSIGLSTGELIIFYESFGFYHLTAINKHLMERKPRIKNTPYNEPLIS